MADFNFIGGDVTAPGGNFNNTGGFNTFNNDTATWTEGGVQFAFSHTGSGQVEAIHQGSYTALGITQLGAGFGSASIDLVGGVSQQFFSNITLNYSYLATGATLKISYIANMTASGAAMASAVVGTDTAMGAGTVVATESFTGQFNIIKFTFTNAASGVKGFGLTGFTSTINCFLADTEIATPKGGVNIQDLREGDEILTADGRVAKVKWLGEQNVNTRFTNPAETNPILIKAGALADGVPARDLRVSGDHAIAMDGALYNAAALINGRTITRVATMPKEGFTYYHVETEAHELLLAENTPAETFIDYAGRDSFYNGDEATTVGIAEMPLPRISSARLVNADLKQHLLDRADMLTVSRFAAE